MGVISASTDKLDHFITTLCSSSGANLTLPAGDAVLLENVAYKFTTADFDIAVIFSDAEKHRCMPNIFCKSGFVFACSRRRDIAARGGQRTECNKNHLF